MADGKSSWVVPLLVAFIGVIGVILGLIYPDIKAYFSKVDSFKLENPVIRHDGTLIIHHEDGAYSKEVSLDVEFNGYEFLGAADPISIEGGYKWAFKLENHLSNSGLLENGEYLVKFALPGKGYSQAKKIRIHTQPPSVEAEIISTGERSKKIIGQASNHLPFDENTMKVEIFFKNSGDVTAMELEVERYTDDFGRILFRFETMIQEIPKFEPSDPRYTEDFFAILVTDIAGNKFIQEYGYDTFMSRSAIRFGSNPAVIEVGRQYTSDTNIVLQFDVSPRRHQVSMLHGEPLIVLKATQAGLTWTDLPEHLRKVKPMTTVMEKGKPIGVTFGNSFQLDENDSGKTFQVSQEGRDGQIYGSSEAIYANYREIKMPVYFIDCQQDVPLKFIGPSDSINLIEGLFLEAEIIWPNPRPPCELLEMLSYRKIVLPSTPIRSKDNVSIQFDLIGISGEISAL